MSGPVKNADDDLMRIDALCLRHRFDILPHRLVEVDDVIGISGADRQLFHVDVGRVQQAAFFRNGENRERVGTGLRRDRRPFQRIESNVDLRACSDRVADLLADVEHRCFVALTFADDDGAVHVEVVECHAHRFDSGSVSRFFVAASNQLRGGDGGRFGDAHHLKHQDTIEN